MAARGRKIFWFLFPSYLCLALLSILAVAGFAAESMRTFNRERTVAGLEASARLAEALFEDARLSPENRPALARRCREAAARASVRVTLVAPSGTVLGDSHEDAARMTSHADRPEIRAALAGRTGVSSRRSSTSGIEMLYVAVPLRRGGATAGAVRVSMPAASLGEELRGLLGWLAAGCAAVALLAAVVSALLARRINSPLLEMERGAERFARGDLAVRIAAPDWEETARLAAAMNDMAGQIGDRILDITARKKELEAILASMAESVIAVDGNARIVLLNHAACRLLDTTREAAEGRLLHEVARSAALLELSAAVLEQGAVRDAELTLYAGKGEAVLRARITPVTYRAGEGAGAIVVLQDVTRRRKLERVRKDFVANVSHELKTPLTAIKASLETLRDGALDDPAHAARFVDIAAAQAERLEKIVEDVLALSRLEHDEVAGGIATEETPLAGVIGEAVSLCEAKAAERRVRVVVSCPDGLAARANPALLEQAVYNLVDNAVKYGGEGTEVTVAAAREGGEVVVRVEDRGPGIPPEHRERIFERFYRVDKARSRGLGGTGLGLAIVKHIAGAHGGRVTVESAAGKGSVFRLHLPG